MGGRLFRKTSPQLSMLESQFLLPDVKRQRLEASWAQTFRTVVLPLIDEEMFRGSFHDSQGRPNKSIRLMVSLHILKEMSDLTDLELIDALEFNLQYHYALGVEPRTAHVCQKTLHNYRVLLLDGERSRSVFERVTRGLAEADGLNLGRQRLDSTHVMSNMAVLTRLGLFVETVTFFLRELRREHPDRLERLDPGYARRYLDREGYFSDARRGQRQRRLKAVASDLYRLVVAFDEDEVVASLPSYVLLARLLEEQCEVTPGAPGGARPVQVPAEADADRGDDALARGDDDDDAVEVRADSDPEGEIEAQTGSLRLRDGRDISSDSLQSPHDPDATYGHKGKGYEVQVAETCDQDNAYQVITAVAVNGANVSDQVATVAVVDQLAKSGMPAKVVFADTGYGSGDNIVACAERGVDLQAPVQDPHVPQRTDRMGEPVESSLLEHESSGTDVPAEDGDQVEREDATPEAVADPASVSDGAGPDETPEEARTEGETPEKDASSLTVADFTFNETFDEVLTCPGGAAPFAQHTDASRRTAWSKFATAQCAGCALAARCPTKIRRDGVRTLRTQRSKAATAARQREQQTAAFKERYKIRSGIESTNAELKSRHGAGSLRVRGEARVTMSMQMKATALNVKRAAEHHARLARAEAAEAWEPAHVAPEVLEVAPSAPLVAEDEALSDAAPATAVANRRGSVATSGDPPSSRVAAFRSHVIRRLQAFAGQFIQPSPFGAPATG